MSCLRRPTGPKRPKKNPSAWWIRTLPMCTNGFTDFRHDRHLPRHCHSSSRTPKQMQNMVHLGKNICWMSFRSVIIPGTCHHPCHNPCFWCIFQNCAYCWHLPACGSLYYMKKGELSRWAALGNMNTASKKKKKDWKTGIHTPSKVSTNTLNRAADYSCDKDFQFETGLLSPYLLIPSYDLNALPATVCVAWAIHNPCFRFSFF